MHLARAVLHAIVSAGGAPYGLALPTLAPWPRLASLPRLDSLAGALGGTFPFGHGAPGTGEHALLQADLLTAGGRGQGSSGGRNKTVPMFTVH